MTKRTRSIAVLGTLTRDTTAYADGSRSENLGGIHYSILTLAHLFAGRAQIIPVANVGDDAFADVHAALELPGVDRSHLRRVRQANNHVYLTYTSATDREEVLVGLVPEIEATECAPLFALDWVLVNLTSGRDVTLKAMQELRQSAKGTVQLDVHSLTLGFAANGRRVLVKPEGWERWVACADWVQMNEAEAKLLGDGRPLPAFAEDLLALGLRGVLITLGNHGCLACWQNNGRTTTVHVPVARRPEPAFPTGCGDVFGAGFAFAMLEGASPEAAVRFANAAAGAKACREPYAELRLLRQDIARELTEFIPAV